MDQPYDKETIGPMLARLRQALGYTQDGLAQLLCARSGHVTLTRNEVSRWERQTRIPSEYWLRWLADVLQVPARQLRDAVKAARGYVDTDPLGRLRNLPPGQLVDDPQTVSVLTFSHGPREVVIPLGGGEVDLLRTVLNPINP